MRLLMVTTSFPPVIGGVQTYASELAKRFATMADRFAVVAPIARGATASDRGLGFAVHRLPALGDELALSGIAPLAVINRRGFDVAFGVHWASAHAALRAGGVDRVFTAVHGKELLIRPLARVPMAQRVYDHVRRTALERCDGFFPVSHYTGDMLAEAGVDPGRVVVVPNGVDAARFRPREATVLRQRLGIGERRVLLTVARLVRRKGIDTVLAALPAVRARVPEAVYLVVGDGPDRGRLEALAREHGVAEHVRFLGRVPEDIVGYYNACDLFVMPARTEAQDVEGFGLVFLEAGGCEKPVVGARAGGVVDAIVDGETGRLVEPDDPAALADALATILEDPALARRMGKAGRAHVLAQGTWDHAARRIFDAMTAC